MYFKELDKKQEYEDMVKADEDEIKTLSQVMSAENLVLTKQAV